jgi:hypothetical protein
MGRSQQRKHAFVKGNMRNFLTVWSESPKIGEDGEINAIGSNKGVEVWTMYERFKKVFHNRREIFQPGRR